MTTYLLDTNILSAILRRDRFVEERFRQAIADDEMLLLSVVVSFEIKRGLLKRDAKNQMAVFDHLTQQLAWCDVIQDDWEHAAQMWAERFKKGKPIEDADLLIAAQAQRLGATLVTDNAKDFDELGLAVANWKNR